MWVSFHLPFPLYLLILSSSSSTLPFTVSSPYLPSPLSFFCFIILTRCCDRLELSGSTDFFLKPKGFNQVGSVIWFMRKRLKCLCLLRFTANYTLIWFNVCPTLSNVSSHFLIYLSVKFDTSSQDSSNTSWQVSHPNYHGHCSLSISLGKSRGDYEMVISVVCRIAGIVTHMGKGFY